MVSPISNPRFFKRIFVIVSFSNGKLRKNCFGPIRKLLKLRKIREIKFVKNLVKKFRQKNAG